MSKNIEVNLGDRRLAIDPDQIRGKQIKQIYKALNDVKKAHNPLVKYPRLTKEDGSEESYDEWRDRTLIEYAAQLDKKDGEEDDAYDRRLISLALSDHEWTIAQEFINKICEIFNLPAVSEEQFDLAPVEKVFNFCYDLLAVGRIQDPDGMFLPSRRAESLSRV